MLRTDIPSEQAQKILLEFERNYAVLEVVKEFTFSTRPGPDERVNVVLFRSGQDFHEVSPGPKKAEGLNLERDGQRFVVVHEPLYAFVLNHEMVHGLVHHYLWRAPTWLNEGLAEFYSNFRFDGSSVVFGVTPLRRIQRSRFPPLEKLLRATAQQFYDDPAHTSDYYAASAMLVHMLSDDDDRKNFNRYLAAIAQGVPLDDAWKQAFGDVSIEALDHRLREYVGQRTFHGWKTAFTAPTAKIISERTLEDFEVRLLWVQIGDWNRPDGKEWVGALLARARASRPNHPEVLYWSGRYAERWGEHAEAKRLFEAATTAEPEVTRYWVALSGLELEDLDHWGTPTPGPALEQLSRRAQSADELNQVAWYLSMIRRPTEAIPYAIHALEKAPGCYYCRDTMAQIFFQKGAMARAVEEQRLALNLTPENASAMRRKLAMRLANYERAAKEAASAPKPAPPAETETPTETPPASEPPL